MYVVPRHQWYFEPLRVKLKRKLSISKRVAEVVSGELNVTFNSRAQSNDTIQRTIICRFRVFSNCDFAR